MSDQALLAAMKAALPIPMFFTKRVSELTDRDGLRLGRPGQKVSVKDVRDIGDMGGIVCVIGLDQGRRMVVASLTHLKADSRHPLYKEIRAYQINRSKRLALEQAAGAGADEGSLRD
jgi:hypothetical protein